jgi:translation initiation factor eIF-2B subunit epsilon
MVDRNEEEPLVALVFADPCTDVSGLTGAAAEAVKAASIPVHGASLLHWQLYVLARSGVDEAIVLSSTPRLDLPTGPIAGHMKVVPLSNPTWCSPGDALREVESRVSTRPRHDFVIVHHGALFNIDVRAFVQKHKQRCKADRNWLVSVTLRRGVACTPLVTALQSDTGALCFFSDSPSLIAVNLDAKSENVGLRFGGKVQILADVVDVGLDVCSPDFLIEFRENFDFDSIRDYIRAKLDGGEAELLGNRIFAHMVDSSAAEYGTRVDSISAHMAATWDVFDGWMIPIRACRVLSLAESRRISVRKGNLTCLGDDQFWTETFRGEVSDVVVGKGAAIASDAVLTRCVIGDGVRIGKGVKLEDSVIIAHGIIPSHANLVRKCVADQGVNLYNEDCRWPNFLDDIESDPDDELEGAIASGDDEDRDANGEEGTYLDGQLTVDETVGQEIRETVERGVQLKADVEAITLEVRHLTREYELNCGKPVRSPLLHIVSGIVDVVLEDCSSNSSRAAPGLVKSAFTEWRQLINSFSSQFDLKQQRELVDGTAGTFKSSGRLLMYIWKVLYDTDVLEEDAILQWAASIRKEVAAGRDDGELLEHVREFVDWLEQAEEEDDDDDENE